MCKASPSVYISGIVNAILYSAWNGLFNASKAQRAQYYSTVHNSQIICTELNLWKLGTRFLYRVYKIMYLLEFWLPSNEGRPVYCTNVQLCTNKCIAQIACCTLILRFIGLGWFVASPNSNPSLEFSQRDFRPLREQFSSTHWEKTRRRLLVRARRIAS